MDDLKIVLVKVISLFIMILPGFILRKRKMISDSFTGDASTMLLYVTQPLMIIHSFIRPFDPSLIKPLLTVLVMSLIIHTLFYFISLFLFKRVEDGKAKVLRFITVFSNAGYMCFPILYAVFGPDGVLFGSVYCVVFNIYVWTVGISLYRKDARAFRMKNVLFNPSSIATMIAFVIFAFSLHEYIPAFIVETVNLIGQMTAPLSMLLVGARLADVRLKGAFSDLPMFGAIGIRLVAAPLITLLIAKAFGLSGYGLMVPYISAAMPAATASAIFAEKLGADSAYASKCVVISTLLSVATIPVMLMVLSFFA